MAKRNTMKTHGFIPCTPMRDMAKGESENKSIKRRTPYQLTTNELLKKLCDNGPDGCGPQCGNWDVCLYGKAIVEKLKDMKIIAKITLANGELITRYFIGWKDVCAWIDRHYDHITAVDAKVRKTTEIRQGRENDG